MATTAMDEEEEEGEEEEEEEEEDGDRGLIHPATIEAGPHPRRLFITADAGGGRGSSFNIPSTGPPLPLSSSSSSVAAAAAASTAAAAAAVGVIMRRRRGREEVGCHVMYTRMHV